MKAEPGGSYTALSYLLKHSQRKNEWGPFALSALVNGSAAQPLKVLPSLDFIAS